MLVHRDTQTANIMYASTLSYNDLKEEKKIAWKY